MRTILWASALLLASTAHAGKRGKKGSNGHIKLATLPCDWEPGTTFHYQHIRRRTDSHKPQLAQVSTTTPVTVTVQAGGDEPLFLYDVAVSDFEGPEVLVAAVRAITGKVDPLALELVMREGTIVEVRNREEVVAQMEPMLRAMIPADAPPQVLEQTLSMFRDPVSGTQLLLKDPIKLFALHCVQLEVGQVFETPTQFPNPFGGPPIDGYSRIELAAHDAAAGTITLRTLDRTDPESIKAMMPAVMSRFAPDNPSVGPDEIAKALNDLPPIASVMEGTLVYSLADGFPLSVEVHNAVGSPDHPARKSDTWIWTRIEPPEVDTE